MVVCQRLDLRVPGAWISAGTTFSTNSIVLCVVDCLMTLVGITNEWALFFATLTVTIFANFAFCPVEYGRPSGSTYFARNRPISQFKAWFLYLDEQLLNMTSPWWKVRIICFWWFFDWKLPTDIHGVLLAFWEKFVRNTTRKKTGLNHLKLYF